MFPCVYITVQIKRKIFFLPPGKQYGVKDVIEGIEYEFRVSAINFSGPGEPSSPSDFVVARDPKSES